MHSPGMLATMFEMISIRATRSGRGTKQTRQKLMRVWGATNCALGIFLRIHGVLGFGKDCLVHRIGATQSGRGTKQTRQKLMRVWGATNCALGIFFRIHGVLGFGKDCLVHRMGATRSGMGTKQTRQKLVKAWGGVVHRFNLKVVLTYI